MIKITDKKNCCGCTACSMICPRNCIKMDQDEEGFLYPAVNVEKCIQCGLCESVCPILKTVKKEKRVCTAYGAYALDEKIRMSSSSGGIFVCIGQKVIGNQGVVFGASFSETFEVQHIEAQEREQLKKLQGSKYSQSELGNTFQKVKKYLEDGREVLFSGTPCQVAGLKKYLGKEYENLILLDILCHGVPSPKVWKEYLHTLEKAYHSSIQDVKFRDKTNGWYNYSMKIDFLEDNYNKDHSSDLFMRLFLSDFILRPSCYECRYKEIPRCSDITLGDFWGVDKVDPELYDDKGTSIILTHTEKGEQFIEKIAQDSIIRKVKLNVALPENSDSRKSVREPLKRKKVFSYINRNGINGVEKFLTLSYKTRIINKIKMIIKR